MNLVVQITDDLRCSQCDHRSICIRLLNSTEIHCICLPGFVYSSTIDRCVLKSKFFFFFFFFIKIELNKQKLVFVFK